MWETSNNKKTIYLQGKKREIKVTEKVFGG